MAISTYSELKTACANWMARTSLSDRIPEFITLAEAKFNRLLFVPQMEQRSTATVDTTSDDPQYITLPSDFQTMRRVRLNGVTGKPRLEFMSHTQIDDYRTCTDDVSGQPLYFSILGSEMELAPTPNEDYSLEMVYRKNIPALSDSNTTNWLLTFAPDAYLYGALMEAAAFMVEDERIPLWAAALKSVVDNINDLGERRAYGAGPSGISLPGVNP
jgi:hypothetical protein